LASSPCFKRKKEKKGKQEIASKFFDEINLASPQRATSLPYILSRKGKRGKEGAQTAQNIA